MRPIADDSENEEGGTMMIMKDHAKYRLTKTTKGVENNDVQDKATSRKQTR